MACAHTPAYIRICQISLKPVGKSALAIALPMPPCSSQKQMHKIVLPAPCLFLRDSMEVGPSRVVAREGVPACFKLAREP